MVVNPEVPCTPPAEKRHPGEEGSPVHGPSDAYGTPTPLTLVPSALLLPRKVRIVEVGPRDGLQTESTHLAASVKISLIRELFKAGLRYIETTAFVSHRLVPRLADAAEVLQGAHRAVPEARLSALVPNMRGLSDAIDVGVREISVIAAASDSFSKANVGCGVDEALERYKSVISAACNANIRVRAYISCAFGGCPYSGHVSIHDVAHVAKQLFTMGAHEIALADTRGAATPRDVVDTVLAVIKAGIPVDHIAVHFHDTRGTALANVLAAMSVGVSVIDAAVAGLGGCPFAPGAAGNLATEDLVHMLNGMHICVGNVDLDKLIDVGFNICDKLSRLSSSRVAIAARAAHHIKS